MKLLEIARGLGMNVNQLCEFTGYSRQGLHQFLNQKSKVNPRIINALELHICQQYNREIKEAEEARRNRLEILEMLRNEPKGKVE